MGATTEFIFQAAARRGPSIINAESRIERVAARKWYRDKASKIRYVAANKIMSSDPSRLSSNILPTDVGKMLMYFYDPKLKRKLPYYDMFPLIFILNVYKDGFLGINLHYLPPMLRAKLMDALYSTINNSRYDDTTKMRISYRILNRAAKYRWFKPCIKKYLWGHLRSKFFYVDPTDWDTVLMLPLERFEKANKSHVWQESIRKLGS